MTQSQCLHALDETERLVCKRRVREMLELSAENAASPREIIAHMLLCLPSRLGGYGLPRPDLNSPIAVRKADAEKIGVSHLRGDLVWHEQKLVVEYDSDAFHAGARKIQEDSRRRSILTDSGYAVLTLTNNQIVYEMETDRFARVLAKSLGVRIRQRSRASQEQKALLRHELLLELRSWQPSTP